ncbi:MAG: hypothetical protein EOO36_08965 [Cytophagaceae bacterium]|nr:MAG: hypothetical protein EOO36_08965 [Cytophagaceae bacterium]
MLALPAALAAATSCWGAVVGFHLLMVGHELRVGGRGQGGGRIGGRGRGGRFGGGRGSGFVAAVAACQRGG